MINISLSIDTARLERLMADFPQALAAAQRNALNQIGNTINNRMIDSFKIPKLRPSPWAPRKPTYIVTVNKKTGKKKRKLDDHPLLIKSGDMRQGIGYYLEGMDSVVIGTTKEYIMFHQTGTKYMPARLVFPLDKNGDLVWTSDRSSCVRSRRHFQTR